MSLTDIICETRQRALVDGMDGGPWQKRLDAMGISQRGLAEAIGYTAPKLSAALRGKGMANGVPQHLKALILALERLSESKRAEWLIAAKAERKRPDGGK
jgi:hypothetical protein